MFVGIELRGATPPPPPPWAWAGSMRRDRRPGRGLDRFFFFQRSPDYEHNLKGLMDFLDYTTPFLYDVEHECSEDCWCEPDIVEIGEDITIFRHNRGVC